MVLSGSGGVNVGEAESFGTFSTPVGCDRFWVNSKLCRISLSPPLRLLDNDLRLMPNSNLV